MRAKLESAAVLLGSATPSLESYHHAREGKYTLLRLESRVANRELARVEIVDMRQDFKKTHRASAISSRLREAHCGTACDRRAIAHPHQSPWLFFFWRCAEGCGASIQCENCSISLTYHKKRQRMVCHYCGFNIAVVKKCPKWQFAVRLFRRRRRGTAGRIFTRTFSRRAYRPPGSRHGAHQARISENSRIVCFRKA